MAIELQASSQPTYTVETLRALSAQLGPDQSLKFILGVDALRSLHSWGSYQECLALADFIPVRRSESTRDDLLLLKPTLGAATTLKLYRNFVDVRTSPLSSTAIRQELQRR